MVPSESYCAGFFTESYCAGVSNKHCLMTFFIFFVVLPDMVRGVSNKHCLMTFFIFFVVLPDMDLQCFQKQINSGSARHGLCPI